MPTLTAAEIDSRGSEEQRAQWLGPTTETAMDAEVPLVKTRSGILTAERDADIKIPCPTYHRTYYLRLHHLRRLCANVGLKTQILMKRDTY